MGLGLFLVLTQWNGILAPFERDEGEYAYNAWMMDSGGLPYHDSFLQKPPLIIYTYLLGEKFAPGAVWPPRVLAAAFLVGTIILLWLIARRRWGADAAWATAWIFSALMPLPTMLAFAANTERFMLLPLVAALAIVWRRWDDASAWDWFWAGLCAAAALAYKPIALPALLVLFGAWLWRSRRLGARPVLGRLAAAALAAAAAAVLVLGYFAWRGALAEVWECAVTYNRYYAADAIGWGGIHLLERMLVRFATEAYAAAGLLALSLIVRPSGWRLLWTLLLACLLAVYRDPNGHYYIMMLPMAALLCGATLAGLLQRLPARARPWSLALAIAAMTACTCWPLRQRLIASPARLTWLTYHGNPFVESGEVARRVAELTKPDDKVFVAGSEPQILYYARRRGATRFDILYPLMLPSPLAARYQQQVVDELRRNPPEFIVFSKSRMSWLITSATPHVFYDYLEPLIRESYAPVGAYVWNGDQGRWLEPWTGPQPGASLIVLRRKSGVGLPLPESSVKP